MTWGPWLFILYVTVFFSICIPAGFGGYWYWHWSRHGDNSDDKEALRHARRLLVRQSCVLFAVAYCHFCEIIAGAFGFVGNKPVYTVGYAVTYWQGRFALAAAIVWLVMFLIGGKYTKR